ncbi:MAG: hypothetical protein ACOYXR_11160 [Nitrospirota bacterium]
MAPRAGVLAGIVAVCVGLPACGTPPNETTGSGEEMELTWVDIRQFNAPSPVNDPQQPSVHRVTGDVRLVFRNADHPAALLIDFEAKSGSRTHNELDLATLKPDILEATGGQWSLRAPLMVPELGFLEFTAALVDQRGSSGLIGGGFTVGNAFDGNNGGQASDVNTTTVFDGP